MLLKYGLDSTAVYLVAGEFWTPLDYLTPVFEDRGRKLSGAPAWFLMVMALWTLPFIWIGASMSTRRAADAGRSGWYTLDIHPAWYWRTLSEPLLHAIHGRVLKHVKELSEG